MSADRLTERTDERQRGEESHRRWFSSEYFDLIVWFNDGGDIVLFQLGYDPDGADGLLEWRPASGLSHFRVDTGGLAPARHARAPFLVPAPAPPLKPLIDGFKEAAAGLDESITDFVLGVLRS